MNIPKPGAGEPTLLTYDEAETLFHEFGHALHGLLARVRYPSQAGTNVYRDFVELPSQVNELWMLRPEVLANYAVHHETGERMPQELVDRLIAAHGFNAGFDDGGVPRRGRARPGLAPHRRRRRRHGRRRIRACRARRCGPRRSARAAPVLEHLLRPRLRGRVRRRATTRTSGARCRARTSWRGSNSMAARRARTASGTDARSSSPAAHATRASRSVRCSVATPRSVRCSPAAAWRDR